jgi:hypothetical protein
MKDRINKIQGYTRLIADLHHQLTLQTLKIIDLRRKIEEERRAIDSREGMQVQMDVKAKTLEKREIGQSKADAVNLHNTNHKVPDQRRTSETFPQDDFPVFGQADFQMLQKEWAAHNQFAEQVLMWRNEVINAVGD